MRKRHKHYTFFHAAVTRNDVHIHHAVRAECGWNGQYPAPVYPRKSVKVKMTEFLSSRWNSGRASRRNRLLPHAQISLSCVSNQPASEEYYRLRRLQYHALMVHACDTDANISSLSAYESRCSPERRDSRCQSDATSDQCAENTCRHHYVVARHNGISSVFNGSTTDAVRLTASSGRFDELRHNANAASQTGWHHILRPSNILSCISLTAQL